MPIFAGTKRLKFAKGEYDFAVDGGAVGTITLREDPADVLGNVIPAGSIAIGGWIEVDTGLTSGGAATASIQTEAAGDTVAAAAVSGVPWSAPGRQNIIPNWTGAASLKTTADRGLAMVIGAFALTAGKCRVVVAYL